MYELVPLLLVGSVGTPPLLKFIESARLEHSISLWTADQPGKDAVPPLLDWDSFDNDVTIVVPPKGRVIACLETFRFADPRWNYLL